jgi:nitrate/nitrite transporter NarK
MTAARTTIIRSKLKATKTLSKPEAELLHRGLPYGFYFTTFGGFMALTAWLPQGMPHAHGC